MIVELGTIILDTKNTRF